MKVLIADDSGVMRKVIARELNAMNIPDEQILQAQDGAEAVKMAQSDSPNLILMDWNMPNMLGIDAVKAIREAGLKIPIIMITTEAERSNVIAAIQAGANNYLSKPFSKESFQEKVMPLLSELGAPPATPQAVPSSSVGAPPDPTVDVFEGKISL